MAPEELPRLFLTLPHFSYDCISKIIVDLRMFWTDPAFAVLAEDIPGVVSIAAIITFPETRILGH